MTVEPNAHPFVERVRAEREIVSAVNACRPVLKAELTGTSTKAISAWFGEIPSSVRNREDVLALRQRLNEAGRIARLASSGSHRGAMVGERLRSEVIESSVRLVRITARRVRRGCD